MRQDPWTVEDVASVVTSLQSIAADMSATSVDVDGIGTELTAVAVDVDSVEASALAAYGLQGFIVDCILIAFGMWVYAFIIRNKELWESRKDA